MKDTISRFDNRVADYIKYRPHYPIDVLSFFQQKLALLPSDIIADIGSGTGISAELFISNGNRIFGIEPNSLMRAAAETKYHNHDNFISIDATAENTTLDDQSVDFVISGQAFHWFDTLAFKTEVSRIIKPRGWVVLFWNSRATDDEFSHAYDQFCNNYGDNYSQIVHTQQETERLSVFFNNYQQERFNHYQEFDFQGLLGRFLSSSYAPTQEEKIFAEMKAALLQLFNHYQRKNRIIFPYQTELYYGNI